MAEEDRIERLAKAISELSEKISKVEKDLARTVRITDTEGIYVQIHKADIQLESKNPNFQKSFQTIVRNELNRQRLVMHKALREMFEEGVDMYTDSGGGPERKLKLVDDDEKDKRSSGDEGQDET